MRVKSCFVWVRHDASSCESMFAMILGINDWFITDLIAYILWLSQLNNCNKSYKHAEKHLLSLSFVRKQGRRSLSQAGYSSYLWASVLIPLAARPLCHACDIGLLVAKQRPFPRLTAASWQHAHHNGRETFLLHLYSPGAAALLQEQERQRGREGAREGVSSTPLLCCDHTSPAWKRVSSSHITQEVCCSTLHLLSLYLMYQRRGTSEIWGWAGSSVTTVQGSLMPFPCSASLIGTVMLPQLLFSKRTDASRGHRVIYLTRNIFLFWSPFPLVSNFSKV